LRQLRGRRVVKFSPSVSADRWGLVEMFCAYESSLSKASFQLILQQIYEMEKRNKIKGKFSLQKS
jgi:hypothetical protein